MVEAVGNTQTDEARARFEAARARYKALQDTGSNREVFEQDNEPGDLSEMLRYLQKKAESGAIPAPPTIVTSGIPTAANVNDIPVPLPVKPIDPAMITNQVKTNDILEDIQNTITATSLPQPVKIDDSSIAHESTLQDVAGILSQLLTDLRDFADQLTDQFANARKEWARGLSLFADTSRDDRGWVARAVDKALNYVREASPALEKVFGHFSKITTPIVDIAKRMLGYLKGIFEIQEKVFDRDDVTRARELVEGEGGGKRGPFDALMSVIAPSDSVLRKGINGVKALFGAIERLGEFTENAVKSQGSGGGIMSWLGSGVGSIGTTILRFLGIFTGIGSAVTAIVSSAVFASVYAMFKHPEQAFGMLEALGKFFTKVVAPAMAWIAKEILPPLGIAFAALVIAADYLLDTVGTWVNKKLIYGIGTVLPDILKKVGLSIDTLWQSMKSAVNRIAGIFGYGSESDKSLAYNLVGAFADLAVGVLKVLDLWVTEMIHTIGMSNFFGLEGDETLLGRTKRFFMEDIPNFAIGLFDKMMKKVEEYNPIPYIEKKIKDFTAMLTNLIPSWDDMKMWLIDSIPAWVNDSVRNWIIDKLGPEPTQESVPGPNGYMTEDQFKAGLNDLSKLSQPIPRNIEKELESPVNPFMRTQGSVIMYAPSTQNNSTTVAGGGGSSGQISRQIGSTRPEKTALDDLIFKAIAY